MTKAQLIIQEMKRLAREYPDNVYVSPDGYGVECHYNRGRCTQHGVGCIVGQAVVAANIVDFGDEVLNIIQDAKSLLCRDLDVELTDNQLHWVLEFQQEQDKGFTWKECRISADHAAKLSAAEGH